MRAPAKPSTLLKFSVLVDSPRCAHSQKFIYFYFMCRSVFARMCYLSEVVRIPGAGITDTSELPLWVLGIEPGSSGRAGSAFNH